MVQKECRFMITTRLDPVRGRSAVPLPSAPRAKNRDPGPGRRRDAIPALRAGHGRAGLVDSVETVGGWSTQRPEPDLTAAVAVCVGREWETSREAARCSPVVSRRTFFFIVSRGRAAEGRCPPKHVHGCVRSP